MEQGPITAPNQASFNRLSGKAIFFQTGSAGGVDLGYIDMIKASYGAKTEQVKIAIDGNVVLAMEENVEVAPVFTINGKQFHTPINPLLLLGTKNADVVQAAGTAATLTVTAKLGQTFDIGARNISNVVVSVSGSAKAADVDFFLEANKGLIRFPVVAAGIADGASVLITFDKPAITRESYTAFNNLNMTGTLKVFEMDNKSAIPMAEWSLPGSLTADSAGDIDATKHKQWTIKFAINGQPTCLRRAA